MPTDRNYDAIPAAALRANVGPFRLGDNGDDAKTAPVEILARTGQPIDHWYWGRLVHDLAGMTWHKSHLPIDYCHDDREILGFLNKSNIESGDLIVSGALVRHQPGDRVDEILTKVPAGVPYEASIDYRGPGIVLEHLEDDTATAEVNGYTLTGPATIVRKWPLRSVAICPYGYDHNTQTALDGDAPTYAVELLTTDPQPDTEADPMAKNSKTLTDGSAAADDQADTLTDGQTEAAEANQADNETTEPADATPADDTQPAEAATAVDAADPPAELSDSRAEVARYLDAFGDAGGRYFAEGLSYENALARHLENVTAERDDLAGRLAAIDRGETSALSATDGEGEGVTGGDDATPDPKAEKLAQNLGPNIGKAAAAIKIRRA